MRTHRMLIGLMTLIGLTLCAGVSIARQQQESWSFEAKDRVRINTVSGDCEIQKGTTDKIEVEVRWSYRPSDSFEPRVKERGSVLRLSEKMHGSNSGRSTWIVSVPEGTEVDFSSASGDLTISGVTGEFSAETASGDVMVEDSDGEFDFNTASGDIEMVGCKGMYSINTASGDIDLRACQGEFEVSSASGDIDATAIEFSEGSAFSASSGDIDITLSNGMNHDLVLSSASGDVFLDYGGNGIKGTFEFIAKKRSGRIDAPYDFDDEEVFRRWGDRYIRKTFTKGSDTPVIRLETASGSVALDEG